MDTAFSIVSIPVADQDLALDFYTRKLGFELLADDPLGPDRRWVQVRPPSGVTSVTLVTWFPSMPAGSARGMVLAATDLELAFDELSRRGVTFANGIQQAPWGRFTEFYDPDGNGWVLMQEASS